MEKFKCTRIIDGVYAVVGFGIVAKEGSAWILRPIVSSDEQGVWFGESIGPFKQKKLALEYLGVNRAEIDESVTLDTKSVDQEAEDLFG